MRGGAGAAGWAAAGAVVGFGACEDGGGADRHLVVVRLSEAEAAYAEPFAVVWTVRELDDGRVLAGRG